jgi:two-component system chemotaxis response regulator CheB
VISSLLGAVRARFPFPVAVVQHIAQGFARGLAGWLEQTAGHEVVLVEHSQALEPGRVYLASDDSHLIFPDRLRVAPSGGAPDQHQRPSINVMFESAAASFGDATVAILLGGMGSDGTRGLRELRRVGATTLVQDPASCAVGSMPASAIEAGVADRVMAPADLAEALCRLASARAALCSPSSIP